jgi:hypothetical protein
MTWTVVYASKAEQELAAIWLGSSERDAVTWAAHQLDVQLKFDPDRKGRALPDGRRTIYLLPLALLYEVHSEDRLVRVIHVWQIAIEQLNGASK